MSTMRRPWALSLLLISSKHSPIKAISLSKCDYHEVNLESPDGVYNLGIFDCDFDEDLYLKSRVDSNLEPIISTASKDEISDAIANSTSVSVIPWANFASLFVLDFAGMVVPNSLWSYNNNLKLSCTHGDINFELKQKPTHEPPIDFLYSLPPMPNSVNELWQAFGAYKWPEQPVSRRTSFGVMLDAGGMTKSDIDSCIEAEKLIVSTDTSPIGSCDECSFVPLYGSCGEDNFQCGCTADKCSIWKYSDASGNDINVSSSVVVQHMDSTCNLDNFKNFTNARLPQLYHLLENAKTMKESDSAILSYATIVNNVEYLKCRRTLDSLYTTTTSPVSLKDVRACENPNDDTDPCCNEALRWSDCCMPEDKTVTISGVYNASNHGAIQSSCGKNAKVVNELLDSEISQILISTSHPELGCKAKYEKAVPQHGDDDIYETLSASTSTCVDEVLHGKTIAGEEFCSADDECWSKSCTNEGDDKRCMRLNGEAVSEPLLQCVISKIDKKLLKHIAKIINVNPSDLKKGARFSKARGRFPKAQWKDAVAKFQKHIGSPNCVGDEAESGICALVDVTKEECLQINYHYDWQRQMEWVEDDTNPNGGFCKKRNSYYFTGESSFHVHGHTEDVQAECEGMFSLMQGSCVDSTMPTGNTNWQYKTEPECNGETESWFSFSSRKVEGYRLQSTVIWGIDKETGNWKETVVRGDKSKCELQKSCNWDPEGRVTAGDEALCLDPSSLAGSSYPRGAFEDSDGKKMACLQCWGSRCEEFWHASPSICAVSPWEHQCSENSGGGPNNDQPITAHSDILGDESHFQCRRNELDTEASCLPNSICPVPKSNPFDDWIWSCAESSCWDLTKSESDCVYDDTSKIHYGWQSEWKAGSGACRLEYDEDIKSSFDGRSHCESKGALWWEGRAFKPGKFNSEEECTSYCSDGSWPIQKTCPTGSCNKHCEQCVVGDEWRFPDGAACYLTGEITEQDCYSDALRKDYEWDWESKLCYRKSFSGSEKDCMALDVRKYPLGIDNFGEFYSFSFSYDYTPPGDKKSRPINLSHQYVSCTEQAAKSTCAAYCWAKDYEDYSSCHSADLEWDWALSRCLYPSWKSNRPTSPTCESYADKMDVDSADHERWEAASACWSAGCDFDFGSEEFAATCSGTPKGCDVQEGNTEWVDGGNEATSLAKASLLSCRWDEWRKCPTEETCLAAGECDDWFLDRGKCIVPFEPNQWGDRKDCRRMKNPFDGTEYEHGDRLGCVATKGGEQRVLVPERECGSVGGTWHTRAKTKAQCEDDRGMICSDPYDEWHIYGGITSESKCDTCGYSPDTPTKWNAGIWSESGGETPLYWTQRAYSTKNRWEDESFNEEKYRQLIRNAVSRYVAEAFKSMVYCELGPYEAWIPVINSFCGASGGDDDEQQRIVSYDLSSATVSCSDMTNQPPMETFEGSINYPNASCTVGEDKFAEITIGKVVSLADEYPSAEDAGTQRVRRRASERQCVIHAVIKNSYNELVGQKLGSGLTVRGIDGATVCINPTVPNSEVCDEYVEYGIVTVNSNGSYSAPLDVNVDVNSKGEVCFDNSMSGVTYVPVKLESGWSTKGEDNTQFPSVTPSIAPSSNSTSHLSSSPTLAPSPSSSPTLTASPTLSSSPTGNTSESPNTTDPTSSGTLTGASQVKIATAMFIILALVLM